MFFPIQHDTATEQLQHTHLAMEESLGSCKNRSLTQGLFLVWKDAQVSTHESISFLTLIKNPENREKAATMRASAHA